MQNQYNSAFAVIGGNVPTAIADRLRDFFHHVILLPADEKIDVPVSHHPDMNFAVVRDTLITDENYYLCNAKEAIDRICFLGGFKLALSKDRRSADYPHDVGFNALILGNILIGRLDALSGNILALAEECGLKPINVKQGYTACSTLSVPSKNLIFTADRGIASVCERHGADVVRIPDKTGITLSGYNCGFIGGCTGVWEDTVFFYGDPQEHPSLEPMCQVLEKRGIETVPLSADMLTDYGGIRIFPIA